MKKLCFSALGKVTAGFLLLSLLLFLPAGTVDYPNAWYLLGLLFVPMVPVGILLLVKRPDLLEKRLQMKETKAEQVQVIQCSALMFVVGFVLAALDFRYSWLPLPQAVSYIASGVFALGYLIYGEVLRENTYLFRTVEVQAHQKVIDTGLYGIVRHPMYSATILLFLSMPLILGSLISFGVFLFYPLILVKRIRNEEALLEAELEGYAEYQKKVRYRLIPFAW